ncbi:hypothetical protein D3C73_1145770 [compost metagenome]
MLSACDVSSTELLKVQVKSPPLRRPASALTICSTAPTLSMSDTFTPVSTLVSKLLYAVPPLSVLYELGTVSVLDDARYASNEAALAGTVPSLELA